MNPSGSTPTRFLVTTPGLSATRWLCFALASHPDVFVAHGKHALDSIVRGQFLREKKSDDLESITLGNLAAKFYAQESLGGIFAAYRTLMPRARAVGNVHAFTIEALMKKVGHPDELAGINILNVLRHPVPYIASHTALVRTAEGHPFYQHYGHVMFSEALRRYPELLSIECPDYDLFVAFTVSCLSVCHRAGDFAHSQFESVKMEALTTDLGMLQSVCERLTGLAYPTARLEEYIRHGAINTHRKTGSSGDACAVFNAWAPWQKQLVRLMIPSDVIEALSDCGYDVSMLQTAATPDAPPTLADRLRRLGSGQCFLTGGQNPAGPDNDWQPQLIDEGRAGFNIVRYRRRYHVLSQALGEIDLTQATLDRLQSHAARGECFVADSVAAAHAWITRRTGTDFEAIDRMLGEAVASSSRS